MVVFPDSLVHTLSIYANRWGGPRYRVNDFLKFLNRHIYVFQIKELMEEGKEINVSLASEAFLQSNHTPIYAKSVSLTKTERIFLIKDELGFETDFPENIELLIREGNKILFKKIEDIKPGDFRVINFEAVEELKNDKMHHHTKFNENFQSIECEDDSVAARLQYEAISSMQLLKRDKNILTRIDSFNDKDNCQEIYFVKILEARSADLEIPVFSVSFYDFRHVLLKDRELSAPSMKRISKSINKKKASKYLSMLKSRSFSLKKDEVEFDVELIHETLKDKKE